MAASITAEVRYLNAEWKESEDIPSIGDRESRRANTSKLTVSINDARGMNLDLDTSGFVLTENNSEPADFLDATEVHSTYYPQVNEIVKKLTGADQVFITQHVVRTEDTSDFNAAYARFVHSDYSLSDLRMSRERALANYKNELDGAMSWEFAWYNTWQPFDREVQKNPLAVIDASCLAKDDMIDYYYTGFGSKGLSSMPVFNPNHRMYYFSRMQTNEMMVFKQLDTRPGRALSCPHTSFDLDASEDALGRRSIEVRVVCAFAE
ncbi:MAG: CmcJ/NvfI family oxidoreductase [Gammaproteobacteria bacterium]|nr:CmcJ/NvfI family oxidoreductase [Gammaproteobacteria bacterium]